jgi:SPP1 family holin
MKVSKGTIIRTACLVLALLNTALALFGKSPLPIEDAMIEQVVTFGFTAAASLTAWWKNNSFTTPAIKADKALEEFKALKAAE